MAVRREELSTGAEAVVVRFPVERASARSAMRRRVQRRRRLVAWVAALGTGALLVTGAVTQGGVPASRAEAPTAVVVKSGESLWDIAARYAPRDTDLRAYIEAIERLNQLDGALRAGDSIKLPK